MNGVEFCFRCGLKEEICVMQKVAEWQAKHRHSDGRKPGAITTCVTKREQTDVFRVESVICGGVASYKCRSPGDYPVLTAIE